VEGDGDDPDEQACILTGLCDKICSDNGRGPSDKSEAYFVMSPPIIFLKAYFDSHNLLLAPIGNKCQQFYTRLVESLY
jgi:hypothetical protein